MLSVRVIVERAHASPSRAHRKWKGAKMEKEKVKHYHAIGLLALSCAHFFAATNAIPEQLANLLVAVSYALIATTTLD
jgi:hypothetical protein